MSKQIQILTKVARLGDTRYCSHWKLADGTVIETAMTEDEYKALGLKGAGEPKRPLEVPKDAIWISSTGGAPFWDTPDGTLPFGHYEVLPEGGAYLGIGDLVPVKIGGAEPDLLTADQTFSKKTVSSGQAESFRLNSGSLEKL